MNNQYSNSCGCDNAGATMQPASQYKQRKSLAMAYVPWQTWQNVMDGCSGLKHGSIFEELVLPFEGTKAACAFYNRRDSKDMGYNNTYYRRGMK